MCNLQTQGISAKVLPAGWGEKARNKVIQMVSSMELSQSSKQTKCDEVVANTGGYCRKTIHRFMQSDDFLDNIAFYAEQLTVQNATTAEHLYCAIDGTSLNITDRTGNKGLGYINNSNAKGLIVQNSILLDEHKVPCGVLKQKYWARPNEQCESLNWKEIVEDSIETLAKHNLASKTTILLDRGYDCPNIIDILPDKRVRIILRGGQFRAACDASVTTAKQARKVQKPIMEYMNSIPFVAEKLVYVPVPVNNDRSFNLKTRPCLLRLKQADVKVFLKPRRYKDNPNLAVIDGKPKEWLTPVTAVYAEELMPPLGAEPVKWLLWLNYSVDTPEQLSKVLDDYSIRWRIEEYHKIWKTSGTNVEQTQAQTYEMIEKTARVAAVGAINLARIHFQLESNPDAPASTCFDDVEIKAFRVIDKSFYRGRMAKKFGDTTLRFCHAMIARMGGYEIGSANKPGIIVMSRGYIHAITMIRGIRLAMENDFG